MFGIGTSLLGGVRRRVALPPVRWLVRAMAGSPAFGTMQFSLLKWPTGLDVPNRIPLSRGVPNASAMAVDTGGMPRSLPLPEPVHLRPWIPMPSRCRIKRSLGSPPSGARSSSDVTTLVLAAEAKKREARTTAEIDNLYTGSRGPSMKTSKR